MNNSSNNNTTSSSIINNNNKDIKYNSDILFFKIWRNIYIKKIIINHLHNQLYKDNYCKSYCTRYSLTNESYRKYITKIIYSSNEELVPGDFEEGVQIINITNSIGGKLVEGVIPSTCTSLEFKEYNKQIDIGVIPFGIKKLSFGTYFTQSFDQIGILPNSITDLSFGGYFNSKLSPGVIPNSVLKLRINSKVQHGGYSQVLSKGSIPDSVTELVLNAQSLLLTSESLPSSITSLNMYGTLVEPIGPNILPNSITKLSINRLKESFIKGGIPNSVSKLSFKLFYEDLIQPQIIPNSVTTLRVSNLQCLTFGSIPNSVLNLKLKDRLGTNSEYSLVRELKSLSSNLTTSTSTSTSTSTLTLLLSKLTSSFSNNNNNNNNNNSSSNQEPIYETIIPNSVQNLTYDIYRQLKRNEIPSSVTNLILGQYYVYPITPEVIPSSIKTITIHQSNIKLNQSLNELLPSIKIVYK